jgi:sporulation integral membrane protein YlbJ
MYAITKAKNIAITPFAEEPIPRLSGGGLSLFPRGGAAGCALREGGLRGGFLRCSDIPAPYFLKIVKSINKLLSNLGSVFLIIAILIVVFNIFLLIFPQNILAAAREGLMLWFNNVLPSLLPFMIATNMLVSLGFVEVAARFLAPVMQKVFRLPGAAGFGLVTGFTSGYPIGAKTVSNLLQSGKISIKEAQHLLAFCNNAGPLFIVGAVGVGMFNDSRIGYILWITHILAALIVGVLYSGARREISIPQNRENVRANVGSVGKTLGDAVKNSMESMAIIGGLIIFFSVVVAILQILGLPDDSLFGGIVAGIVEVSGGARKISALEPNLFAIAGTAFIIAFGGISIHAQTFHFTAGTGLKNHKYIFAKFLHGIFAAGLTIVILSL